MHDFAPALRSSALGLGLSGATYILAAPPRRPLAPATPAAANSVPDGAADSRSFGRWLAPASLSLGEDCSPRLIGVLVLGLAALRRDSVSGFSAPWTFGPRDSRRRLPGARWRGVIPELPAATRIADARRGLVIGIGDICWPCPPARRPRLVSPINQSSAPRKT